ncbi:MAG: hypothetical protein KBH82_02260 [Syntrophorhabdaceae bacterium]|nr:hypothetical protein [Syntrophorhabdaceae bacterium]MBP8697836.1 hypothetical protein [Syntrophorhabdaceae bacterium]HQG50256.1 hypothetical protein [Syntrophorhabdaceae bacterium]
MGRVLQSYIIRADSFYCPAHIGIMKVEIIGNLFQDVVMYNMCPDGIQNHISAKLHEITVFITSLKNMAGLFICPIVFLSSEYILSAVAP